MLIRPLRAKEGGVKCHTVFGDRLSDDDDDVMCPTDQDKHAEEVISCC